MSAKHDRDRLTARGVATGLLLTVLTALAAQAGIERGEGAGESAAAPLSGEGRFRYEKPLGVAVVPEPAAVATADFDGIGGNDIAIASLGEMAMDPGVLIVLLNDGSGRQYVTVETPVGVDPRGVLVADLDGVNGPDAVVPNASDDTVTVLLNRGEGGGGGARGGLFQDPQTIGVGDLPVAVAAGDVNGDLAPDLAIANQGENTVTILLNDGGGSFTEGQIINTGGQPTDLTLADFEGARGADGDLDLLVVNGDETVQLFVNDGEGNFKLGSTDDLPGAPGIIEPEDVDGDKDIDGVVLGEAGFGPTGAMTILLNNGFGGFQQLVIPVGQEPSSMAIGDFDLDNDPDVMIVTGDGQTRFVQIMRNQFRETGKLFFDVAGVVDRDVNQRFVAGAGLDGPGGVLDLVTIDVDPDGQPVTGAVAVLVGIPPCRGDINGDGMVDMADLGLLLAAWGSCGSCPPVCDGDVNGTCVVDMSDLLIVLSTWGPCP